MILKIDDWIFHIDPVKTMEHSSFAFRSRCTCGYCENYYRSVEDAYPELRPFLEQFCVNIQGPSEMYPFEPTLCLLGYQVNGAILRFGRGPIMAGGVPVMPRPMEGELFMLEVGEIALPWVLEEDMDEVVSPANEPEFLENMFRIMLRRGYFNEMLPS